MIVNYEAWAVDLSRLLDTIAIEADVAEDIDGNGMREVARLCRARFNHDSMLSGRNVK